MRFERSLHPRAGAGPLSRHQSRQLRHRQDAVRRDHRVLGRDAAGAEWCRRIFEPHHLDRRAALVLLGRRASVLREAPAARRLAVGRVARRVVRPRHAGEIRDDLFPARHRCCRRDRSGRPRAAALAVAVARGRDRCRAGAAERDLERAERFRHADPRRPQHPGRRRALQSAARAGIPRRPVRGVRPGDVQRAPDRPGPDHQTRYRPGRPLDAVLRRFLRWRW